VPDHQQPGRNFDNRAGIPLIAQGSWTYPGYCPWFPFRRGGIRQTEAIFNSQAEASQQSLSTSSRSPPYLTLTLILPIFFEVLFLLLGLVVATFPLFLFLFGQFKAPELESILIQALEPFLKTSWFACAA
jgi:hypothetical protein